nr:hypothetical protein [Demequina litorisediminis]
MLQAEVDSVALCRRLDRIEIARGATGVHSGARGDRTKRRIDVQARALVARVNSETRAVNLGEFTQVDHGVAMRARVGE